MEDSAKTLWYKKAWVIVVFLLFFFPVGLILMWAFTKWPRIVKIIITALIAISFFVALLTSEPTTDPTSIPEKIIDQAEKTTEIVVPTEDVRPTINPAFSAYGTEMLEVFDLMQAANDDIIKVGEYGSQLDLDLAQFYLDRAETQFNDAEEKLRQVEIPEGAEKIDSLAKQALGKFRESVALYQNGLTNLDADKINEGVLVYEEAREFISQTTDEIYKLIGETK